MTITAMAMDDGDGEDEKFVPSLQQPLPAFQCVGILPDGSRCIENGVIGLNPQQSVCRNHIRTLNKKDQHDLRELAAAQKEAARLRLSQDLGMAMETIESLLQPGEPAAIRLKAATEIMDRAGLRGGIEIDVGVEQKDDPMDEVRRRLTRLVENDVSRFVAELEAGSDDEHGADDESGTPTTGEGDPAEEGQGD